MKEKVMSGTEIKEALKSIVENTDQCGLDAFVVKRTDSKMKKMSLSETKDDDGSTFRSILKDMFFDIIRETFLSEDVDFTDGSLLANDQHKYYFFRQTEQFHPFQFLSAESESATDFVEEDLDDALGLAFKIRFGEETIWLYQHLWSIMIPNKKKNNIMARMLKFEKQIVFSAQTEKLLTIAKKIDIIVIEDYIVTSNTNLLQNNFGFQDYINHSASIAVKQIITKNIIRNPEKLKEYISRGKPKYAKKMMRISTSRVFDVPSEQLIEKITTLDRWKGKFDIDKETNQIILNTYAHVENIIDLFDERYTRSDITDAEYDTDVKSIAQPLT